MLVAWAALGAYAAQAALPSNIIDLPFERQVTKVPVLPQGWHFFTRDPREDRPLVYLEDDLRAGQPRELLRPNAAPEHLLGLTRGGRARLLEFGWLQAELANVEEIRETDWHECEAEPEDCLEELEAGPEVASPYDEPYLCGDLVIGKRGARPWAWHQRGLVDTPMPQRLQKVTVTC